MVNKDQITELFCTECGDLECEKLQETDNIGLCCYCLVSFGFLTSLECLECQDKEYAIITDSLYSLFFY